ncbi:hypothetical protein FRC12_022325 [Ceratobasidium sp. 428]|nr:hypothetical protein FRC12_022325 [Ceratobasidium sp. 428]
MLVPNAKSQTAKATTPTPAAAPGQRRKRQLMGEVTLSADDETWVKRMMSSCLDEWRATGAGSIRSLIARDEHWVDWKNKFCQPFEKRDFDSKADQEVANKSRQDMIFRPLDVWRNPLGSASLTAVWDSKYNGPEDLEEVVKPPTMQKFENLNKSVNLQIQRAEAAIAAEQAMRKPAPPAQPDASTSDQPPTTEAEPSSTPKPVAKSVSNLGVPAKPGIPSRPGTPVPGAQPQSGSIIARPNDEELPRAPKPAPKLTPKQRMLEEHQLTKTKICWQALRAASLLGHGRVFPQIGIGSVDLLIQEIEKDKKKYEDERAKRLAAKADEAAKASAAPAEEEKKAKAEGMEVDA